jgi:hypothetical protein
MHDSGSPAEADEASSAEAVSDDERASRSA